MQERKAWKLEEWNEHYCRQSGKELAVMSEEDIEAAVVWLRNNRYLKPEDCPEKNCDDYRLACTLGVCYIAIQMCGDI